FLSEVTPIIEPVSIDEGYMDVTDVEHENPVEIAQYIQKQLKSNLDLPCSIGIAPNKFLAKMASDMKKRMGLTILRKRDMTQKLWTLPIEEMHGVGEIINDKLNSINHMKIWTQVRMDMTDIQ